MDILDRVAPAARDLLGRVDSALLAAGAPADHVIWSLLRRVGALPGDVLESFGALRPATLRAAASDLRTLAARYVDERGSLVEAGASADWEGSAAQAFQARVRAMANHIGDRVDPGDGTLSGRLAATASYVDSMADWMASARVELARSLAEALGSTEAVRLHADPGPNTDAAQAAAAIGARVLSTAAHEIDAATAEYDRWAERLDELPFRAVVQPGGRATPTTAAL